MLDSMGTVSCATRRNSAKMRHNVTWSHLVVPNVHLLVPKIAFEELLEENYAHFGLFEDKISPTQTHPVFSEQVNATSRSYLFRNK